MDAKELKKRKKALHLTTAQLAYMAELPIGTVSKIMTGETRNPSHITIEKLDKVLAHEEMLARLQAYVTEFLEYIREHYEEGVDQISFEKEYRKKHNLDNAPLPYALPISTTANALEPALLTDNRVTEKILAELGENRQVELIDGHLVINEMPDMAHQVIVQNLGERIRDFIKAENGKCKMFNVGVNVRLDEDDYTIVIPDIAVLCDQSRLDEKGIVGPPDWVIEVVSPSTRSIDYNRKMHKYMSAGVREYWIIDSEKGKVATFIEGEPMMVNIYSFEDDIPVYIYDGKLKICIGKL